MLELVVMLGKLASTECSTLLSQHLLEAVQWRRDQVAPAAEADIESKNRRIIFSSEQEVVAFG